jgi:hypothetical protein
MSKYDIFTLRNQELQHSNEYIPKSVRLTSLLWCEVKKFITTQHFFFLIPYICKDEINRFMKNKDVFKFLRLVNLKYVKFTT